MRRVSRASLLIWKDLPLHPWAGRQSSSTLPNLSSLFSVASAIPRICRQTGPSRAAQPDSFGRYSQPPPLYSWGISSCSFSDRGPDRHQPNRSIPLLPTPQDRRTSARALLRSKACNPGYRRLPAAPLGFNLACPSPSLHRAHS